MPNPQPTDPAGSARRPDVSCRRVLVMALIVLAPPTLVAYGWGLEQLIRAMGGA